MKAHLKTIATILCALLLIAFIAYAVYVKNILLAFSPLIVVWTIAIYLGLYDEYKDNNNPPRPKK